MSTKDNRLSFRIDKKTSQVVDKMVDDEDRVRDRSDFGTQSILHYIDIIDRKPFPLLVLINALDKLGEKANLSNDKDFKELKSLGERLRKALNFDGNPKE